ncbi:hypothetical protein P278_12300 [Zhouia amylolytica AD3]|uniref:Uncharacterized protein n=1 Tax=Zhouia amylolytica AD3 TaxID=1286632 RepID=W2UNC7_9FLAO|nr:hypothetical protein P278_12300 [Zhouia amylolytica AD3]
MALQKTVISPYFVSGVPKVKIVNNLLITVICEPFNDSFSTP